MAAMTALIPLDGTQLSESAFGLLPLLNALGFERVRLVSIWQGAWDADEALPGHEAGEMREISEKGRSFLGSYLSERAESVRNRGFQVETEVRVGRAADALLEAASQDEIDLVLIATHGRTGIARFRMGSVADKVIKDARCPTLVIGPNVNVDIEHYALRRILVPLDGSSLSETALPVARHIAGLTRASIDVVRAVSITATAYDPTMGVYPVDLLSAMEDAAMTYLERIAASLSDFDASATLLRGSAGERILAHLQERPAELVIMASHGRTGVLRAAMGSVTERLLQGPAPVLVFEPNESRGRLFKDVSNR